jgi:hypothetical protein
MIKKIYIGEDRNDGFRLDFREITPSEISKSTKVIYEKNEDIGYIEAYSLFNYNQNDFVIGRFYLHLDSKGFKFYSFFPISFSGNLDDLKEEYDYFPEEIQNFVEKQKEVKLEKITHIQRKGITSFIEYSFFKNLIERLHPDKNILLDNSNMTGDREAHYNALDIKNGETLDSYFSKLKSFCNSRGLRYNSRNIICKE